LGDLGQYLKDDMDNRKNNKAKNINEQYNYDKALIDYKVDQYRKDIEREFNRKKTSKMQICNDLSDLKNIKSMQHNQRFEMTEAEKKINQGN